MAEFEAWHVDAIQHLVEEEKIDCELSVTDAIDVQLNPLHAQSLKDGYDRLVASGCEPTQKTRYIGPAEAEKVLQSCFHHVMQWLMGAVLRHERGSCMLHLQGRTSMAV